MGATSISEIGKMFLQTQPAAESGGFGKDDGGIDFSKVISQMTAPAGGNASSGNLQTQFQEDSVRGKEPVSGSEYDRYRYHENEIRQQSEAESPDADHVAEKLDAFEKEVKDALKDAFGLTDEQIEEAMKTLGISFADLLNPAMLASLVSELTGAADMGALLCDEGFLNVMQEIGTLGKELLEELGITKEQLTELVKATDPVTEQQPVVDNAAEADLSGNDSELPVLTVETEDHRSNKAQDVMRPDVGTEKTEEPAADTTEEVADTSERTAATEKSGQETAGEETGSRHPDTGMTQAGVSNTVDHVNAGQTEGMNEFSSRLNTENIIRQIVEQVRVNLSNTSTTIEMQLNPENLGKLYLQLTAKDGMVSARIVAQNEMVRAALENQVAELRESMEQSGVRVEAVEVTVGSHEFEKNLEQNARQQERETEEQEKSAKRNRRINLNDLDELSGVMTEEESLVAQMMAEQGNSVDFSA